MPTRPWSYSWLGLVAFVVVCFAVSGVGGAITAPQIGGWYAGLAKPGWTPPGWVFGPVWSALYLGMAIAAWLVWRQGGLASAAAPLGLFGVQLALNLAWSWLFFGLEQSRRGLPRHCASLGGNCRDDSGLLASLRAGRSSVRPLFGLGDVCRRVEFRHLAAERVGEPATRRQSGCRGLRSSACRRARGWRPCRLSSCRAVPGR